MPRRTTQLDCPEPRRASGVDEERRAAGAQQAGKLTAAYGARSFL
ncbi:MAG: hypothetical protein ABR543_11105 [Gemmatimonadaceae bacterium]